MLTIGFARRAATYKRAALLFSDLDRLKAIARDVGPMQFVFAGKAHPATRPARRSSVASSRAARCAEGSPSSIWKSTTWRWRGCLLRRRPLAQQPEAAGGLRHQRHEGRAQRRAQPQHARRLVARGLVEGVTGWAIGDSVEATPRIHGSLVDYTKLRYVIAPLFDEWPTGYARVMRSTVAINGAYFTAQRMVSQYLENAYQLDGASRLQPQTLAKAAGDAARER